MLKFGFRKVDSANREKKKFSLRKKAIIILGAVLCLVVIVLATAYGVFLHYYNKMNITSTDDDKIVTAIDYEDDDINEKDLTEDEKRLLEQLFQEINLSENEGNSDEYESMIANKDVTNILLLGTDSRHKGNRRSRTDTMVILSIDKKNKRMTMTSVLRDTYVTIPGIGKNRLNAAFVYGGANLLFKTFEENFDIHLDKYVQIDFYNFIDLVDTVGGVDMSLSEAEIKVMNKSYIPYINKSLKKKKNANLVKINSSGKYHLNGVQALAYSRVRYVGHGDFGRTERQRKVLNQLIKKTKHLSVSELNDLADIILPMLSTNLSQGEVMSLLLTAKEFLNYKVVSGRMPVDGSYKYLMIRRASVLGVNFDTNRKYWYDLVYGEKKN